MATKAWLTNLLRAVEADETFHIVDTETTGSSARGARVIELATVTVQGGRIVDRFETLIDPGVSVPAWITRITGIHSRMLVGAPSPGEAWGRWMDYLGPGGHFVAHNAPFDWGFLKAEFARDTREWPFLHRHCTVQLARHCLPTLPSRSLEALIGHYRIQVPARHRALADAEATADIFLRLLGGLGAGASAEERLDLLQPPVQGLGVDGLVRPEGR
ncbi:MAG: PolC-type DNA polymerase III [Candidatus Sericytochromatia bacterium]